MRMVVVGSVVSLVIRVGVSICVTYSLVVLGLVIGMGVRSRGGWRCRLWGVLTALLLLLAPHCLL